jgi:amino acid transporter
MGVEAPRAMLLRALGPGMATAIVVGNVIGSGIFAKPGTIAATGADFSLIIGTWVLGGILCLLGALAFCELAVMLPQAGGMYVYLREAYGRPVAFLYGWNEFLFKEPASMGALSMIFTGSLANLLDRQVTPATQVLLALVSIAAIAWINIMGVLWGARVQATLTVIKIATVLLVALAPFVLALFSIPGLDAANYETRLTDPPAYSFATRFGIILLAVMWAYNGWEGIAPVAEEIKHPQRNIPIALFAGIGILTFLYVSANVAYHGVLTMEDLKTAGDHGAERMVSQLLGDAWSKLLSVGIMISTFGAISCSLLISPRVPFAMGRDGAFFRPLGWVHENYRTPVAAILTQATMSISLIVAAALLVYLKSVDEAETVFSMLTDFVIFNGSIFYTLAVLAVLVLRRRRPDLERPYRAWGYPITPILYVGFYFWFLSRIYAEEPLKANVGLGILGVGIMAHFAWRWWDRQRSRAAP